MNVDRALDLEPAHVGAREDVARCPASRPGSGRSGRCRTGSRGGRRARARRRARPGRPARAPRHVSRETRAGVLEARHAPTACPRAARPRAGDVAQRGVRARSQQLAPRALVEVEADAARPDQAAAEAAAAERGRQVEEVAAEPAAVGRRSAGSRRRRPARPGRRCGWPGARARARCRAAPRARGGGAAARERLDRLAVGRRVADRGVPGERLHVVDACACRARRPAPARRRGAGSRARSRGGRPARRGTGSGSAPAR